MRKVNLMDYKDKLKEGDKIKVSHKLEEQEVTGIVGEMYDNGFYFFSNSSYFSGAVGTIDPAEKGFSYSYSISYSSTSYSFYVEEKEKEETGFTKISLKDYKDKIELDDNLIVSDIDRGYRTEGIVGEITSNHFYFFSDHERFNGNTGKINPETKSYNYAWAIRFDENNQYNIFLKSEKEKKEEEKDVKKEKIDVQVVRDFDKISLFIKIPKEMEKFFKKLSEKETAQSSYWKKDSLQGAKFYYISDSYQEMEKKINKDTFNDYGQRLLIRDNGIDLINLAPLRTVGASDGIKIFSEKFSSMDNMDLRYYVKKLGKASKKIWENCMSKKVVEAKVTFEMEI